MRKAAQLRPLLLSACNTGAGAWAEAEAASGLGRAFLYAGPRALLVGALAVGVRTRHRPVSRGRPPTRTLLSVC